MIRRYIFWSMVNLFVFILGYKTYQMLFTGGLMPIDIFQYSVMSIAGASLSVNRILRETVLQQSSIISEHTKKKEP